MSKIPPVVSELMESTRRARYTIKDLERAVARINSDFPRPGIVLSLSKPYDLGTSFGRYYPGYDRPGVYVMLNEAYEVLYVGKSSAGLGGRLGNYFKRGKSRREGMAKWPEFDPVRYLVTLKLPKRRFFEAPSIEEFLIWKLQPPLNTLGVDSS